MQHAPLLSALSALVPEMQSRATELDAKASFPAADIDDLRQIGAFEAVLPVALGGLGAGTERDGLDTVLGMLVTIGRGNLAVGRLFEAHVNAIRLIVRYGTPAQVAAATADVRHGHLFGLWVTDPPGQALTLHDGRLVGSKGPCSGAGHATRALVTVAIRGETRLAVVALSGQEHVTPLGESLPGMRGAANGVVRFDAVLPDSAVIGRADDYMHEPDFSCGAWRTTAVTLGGLNALVDATRRQLRRKGHHEAPLQQERFGRMLIAEETARLWTTAAAECAERGDRPTEDRVAYVNLARIAVETAALSIMTSVQRSLGFGAFIRPNPVERLVRDLSIYLRQPAPDVVLLEAAQHGFAKPQT